MRHRTSRARLFWMLPALLLLVGLTACGGKGGPSGAKAAATATPTAPTATPSPSVPTPQPPPYAFPAFWRSNGPIPGDVGGFAFSRVDPRTGYVCASVPSQPGAYPQPQAARLSGPAPLYVTHDDGATWAPVGAPESGPVPTGPCFVAAGGTSTSDVLLYDSAGLSHSADGGATWSSIPLPSVPNTPTTVGFAGDYTAAGSTHIVVALAVQGEGQLPDPNYATDDGGKTWKPIAASLTAGGQTLQPGFLLWMNGAGLIVPASAGPGGAYPRGSQAPATYYFRSTDGGTTWAPLTMPDTTADQLVFGLAADGHTEYAFCMTIGRQNGTAVRIPYFSADGGAHWRQLPGFVGVANGYPDPYQIYASQMAVLPDGSVVAGTLHNLASGGVGDSGYFRLRTGDANPGWQPLASSWQISQPYGVSLSAGGVRLWVLQATAQGANNLVSLDLS